MCTKKNRYQYFVSNEKVNKTRKGEIMKNLVVSIITVIIITVSLSITFANEMNVLPTFKEHRHMLNSDMDSVRTIIHQEIHPSGLIAELAIISLRDGDDYQDFVEQVFIHHSQIAILDSILIRVIQMHQNMTIMLLILYITITVKKLISTGGEIISIIVADHRLMLIIPW